MPSKEELLNKGKPTKKQQTETSYQREWTAAQSQNLKGMIYYPKTEILFVQFQVVKGKYMNPWYMYKGVKDNIAKQLYEINLHPATNFFNRAIRFNKSYIIQGPIQAPQVTKGAPDEKAD